MGISDWIGLGSAVATLLGVVVAFVALWSQLQALTKQLQVQTFSEYTRRYQEIFLQIPEIFDDQANLDLASLEQTTKLVSYLRAYFDLCLEEYYLYQQGLVDSNTWSIWESGMRRAFSRPIIQQAWQLIKPSSQYGHKFETFVEARMFRVKPTSNF